MHADKSKRAHDKQKEIVKHKLNEISLEIEVPFGILSALGENDEVLLNAAGISGVWFTNAMQCNELYTNASVEFPQNRTLTNRYPLKKAQFKSGCSILKLHDLCISPSYGEIRGKTDRY
jgi:hypothetical protein